MMIFHLNDSIGLDSTAFDIVLNFIFFEWDQLTLDRSSFWYNKIDEISLPKSIRQ